MAVTLPAELRVRRATGADARTLAEHRIGMFRDMGALEVESEEPLAEAATSYFVAAVPRGEYVGWLIHSAGDEHNVVAGAGALIRTLLPRPDGDKRRVLVGREALVMNVYVAREWRRRGLARFLMETLMEWARSAGIVRVVLHASEEGRPLYESMGFVPTNELRYAGDLLTNASRSTRR